MDVSVIVPLYKSEKVVVELINSWFPSANLKTEIIFVDDCCPNRSGEAVLKAWPAARILRNAHNLGYGQACNAGARAATGKHLVFLNADTRVTPGWLEPMIDLFKDPAVGLVGNLQLKDGGPLSGTIDSAGSEWRWPEMTFLHIGRHSHRKQLLSRPFSVTNCPPDLREPAVREMVTGCCFAIPASLFNYIGGFNPGYKVGYWEDVELCLNVRELGYQIMFQPGSVIYHKVAHSKSYNHPHVHGNRHYFMNKWVKSHRLDRLLFSGNRPEDKDPVKHILIQRAGAHGDVLVASGVCAALKERYPGVKISFATECPDVLRGNPSIDAVTRTTQVPRLVCDVFYNLDLCYEKRPGVNILTAYAEVVGVSATDCSVHLSNRPISGLPPSYMVIHAGKTAWAGRDWMPGRFAELSRRLMDAGEKVVAVGTVGEPAIPCTLDLRSKTNVSQLAYVMTKAKLFVGIDSLPMHIAQAVGLRGVSFFGSILPGLRFYHPGMEGISVPDLPCLGCHHRRPAPSTVTRDCETGTHACLELSVDVMLAKVNSLLIQPSTRTARVMQALAQ